MKNLIPTSILLAFTFTLFGQGDFQKGISYYKQGQYAKAIQEFEQIIEESPDYEAGYRVLGDSYLKLRKFAKAAESFKKAIELDESNFVSYWGAAVADYNLRRYRDAIATLTRAEKLARSPRQKYQVYQTRGSSYYNLGEFQQTVSDLEKAVEIQRGVFKDSLQLGVAYFQLGQFEKARPFLEQAAALESSSVDARRFLARLNFKDAVVAIQKEDYATAREMLQRYVETNPRDGEAWFNLGLANLFAGDLEKAEQSFKLSVEYLPNNWEVHDRLGFIYEKTERFSDSLKSYQRAYSLNQDPKISESVDRIKERIRRQNEGS
jgi:tetratricopeptide (TPR) repeat protein